MNALVREVHSSPTAEGATRVLLPGEREWEHRRRALAEGLQLPSDVLELLEELAATLKLEFP
jgi:LDH2 family malate/lactate/ureidoglycolate dehydrogenase